VAGEQLIEGIMDKNELRKIVILLRKKDLSVADIRKANEVVAQNGLRVADLKTAIYFASVGDLQQARLLAGRSATVLQRLF
jgi:hypothetical protein